MESAASQLHIFFVPLMAPGHMIPMIDIARLFAARGTKSTVITTPSNATRFRESIDRDKESALDIDIQIIPFPAVEAGLPEGCENADSVHLKELGNNFNQALGMLQKPFHRLLEEHRPHCVVADMFLPWTADISAKYGIPNIWFNGTCNFSLCMKEYILLHAPEEKVASDLENFVISGFPDNIELNRLQLPKRVGSYGKNKEELQKSDPIREAELKSYGIIVNSVYELESAYADYYKNDIGRKTWNIGPVSLNNTKSIDKVQRGKVSSVPEHTCLNWLGSKKPNSVLYVSFGSLARFPAPQLYEIALGLESSDVPFIWVVRMSENLGNEQLLPEGFAERMEGKGLIIRDWAPQVLILDHPAIGGFMTHCGWNSILEGICAGVPMITWPMFAEQFYNEKIVTQVLKIGIKVGNEICNDWIEPKDVTVTKSTIMEVVTHLMGKREEAEERRTKAKGLREIVRTAMKEGGSSYGDLTVLIDELKKVSLRVIL